MKTCLKCGHPNFKPKNKCPECGQKYGESYNCDPLSASTRSKDYGSLDTIPDAEGVVNGYITKGDPNSRYNKD